jgi:hypothetical protein
MRSGLWSYTGPSEVCEDRTDTYIPQGFAHGITVPVSDYHRAVDHLDTALAEKLDRQILDTDRADAGGLYAPALGFAGASTGSEALLTQLVIGYVTEDSRYYEDDEILDRIRLAAGFHRRVQRPSGLIDLHECNFDSPPDTAFHVAEIATAARLAERSDAAGSDRIGALLEPYLVAAAEGIAAGGFHTANHRWVIVDALAKVHELYPDQTDLIDPIERYLAETIDINADGEYTERSHAIYTNVVNRHLIGASLSLGRPELLAPVRRSLQTTIDLMDDDWTVATAFSSRQDRDQVRVPTAGAANFYYLARLDDDERFVAAANGLLEAGGWDEETVLVQLLSYFARHPEWTTSDLPAGSRREDFVREMPDSGLWRARDGAFSATVGTGTQNLVSLSYGDAKLLGLQLHTPYFGGECVGEEIRFTDAGPVLGVETNYWNESLPGYFEPLGRPVDWGDLERDTRAVRERPDFEIEVSAAHVTDGLDVTVSVSGGLSGVPFAIEARFPPGGTVSVGGASLSGSAGESLFHESGTLYYRRGTDVIGIGPGFSRHRYDPSTPTRPSEAPVRVLLTDWAPLERTLSIRGGSFLELGGLEPPAGPATGVGPR